MNMPVKPIDVGELLKHFLSPAAGMFVGGFLLVTLGVPEVYEQRYTALQQTIQSLETQIELLKEQNKQLIESNRALFTKVEDLTIQVQRLYPN